MSQPVIIQTSTVPVSVVKKSEAKPKKVTPTKDEHAQFIEDNCDHWLLKALIASGKLKPFKCGIGITACPLEFWANLLKNTPESGYVPRKLRLMLDDQVLFEKTL